ncbi:UDP-forming cellulose synthase catalytic subunit [Photobacterium profundum]|uniref:UDP-forming cellulose synthase catalytic subunit n=1 Tax=Photobacterium profundum TaxID=74109 RepID=UPI003D10BB83
MYSGLNVIFKSWIVNIFVQQFEFYEHDGGGVSNRIGRFVLFIWFTFCFVFLKEKINEKPSWKLPLLYYPQINFAKPKMLDFLRFIIQSIWLLIVRQDLSNTNNVAAQNFSSRLKNKVASVFYMPFDHLSLLVIWLEKKASSSENIALINKNKSDELFNAVNYLLLFIVFLLVFLCFTVPFNLQAQTVFIIILWSLAMMFRRMPGRFPTMLLIVLSLTASCRYIWWRYTSTLNWDEPLALVLGLLLLFAETFAWVVLILGYFQNIWPLNRKPAHLPVDTELWPSIDLMIPTYNEDLDVVKATVYASLGVDWPKDKLNIYILDDGKRDSFKKFAKEAGVHYIRRPLNNHAKAGNINYALERSSGEYVAIFDCDHIPTRAFFQLTMGLFLNDPKLALVQTPHHFFSPDPFERNLSNFRDVPNEGSLFYGLIQDGNDLWDGTFFCGSCAVLRRKPLEEIGGIAVETVTEDAHTSLRMHRLGYNSAYLKQPLSAGLATETLSAHVGQRIRWARGMAQIFRVDNPLTGKGLKWQQRLCYANAMLHFLSGIPRIIFLIAPLAFLLLHSYVIYAPALAIVLYVLPHMVHASITNSRIQGDYRFSFWGEVYETVLAWYIARPTTIALFAPHKGTFNVTAKGGLIHKTHYDWVISKPYLALVFLNIIGAGFGIYRLGWGPADEIATVIVNILWTIYNLLILGGAVAVAAETKQIRKDHRVPVKIPMTIRLHSGHLLQAEMNDFSLGGLRVVIGQSLELQQGQKLDIILSRADQEFTFPAKITYSNDCSMGLQLEPLTTQQEVDYVQCTFARADTWTKWQQGYQSDKPLMSMKSVLKVGFNGYNSLLQHSPKPIALIVQSFLKVFDFVGSFRPRNTLKRANYNAY